MANGGQINYSINFNVNKQSLDSLTHTLDQITAKATQFTQTAPDYAEPYREASVAAQELKNILTSSWNVQLGQLDLTKVKNNLENSYGSLQKFKTSLELIGPEGQRAFNQFTQAILSTQTPIKQTSKMVEQMATTFKNTIRYGIASSVWNNFNNQLGKAYNYIKNLDQSLNDIRIVSGQSADQMERFAIQANKAAQAMGATTLDYTKAALIYYQQGLSDTEVSARTDVTVKMANVLGTTASEISSYMTAIWNNFAKGSENLEHYADVITALGAATASSSEEIAEGLNKFAAVANTVGLSYEYATSALATVVAQTRQSADIVGTAFKTLFARIQDLEQGDTLDDGTTLGKYAQALEKVGINIKDSSGELKTMNTILDEMGNKWQTLNDAQKIALAQNVAGTRQYTQLVALMDNWDKFQENLDIAGSAEGTLANQQNIYLDSVEAHLNKLSAAWEGLYDSIFDENSIKVVADALTGLINITNTFVTGLGGGLNSLIYGASLLGEVFSNQVAQSLIRVKTNAEQAKMQIENINALNELFKNIGGIDTSNLSDPSYENILALREELKLNEKIIASKRIMTEEEQKQLDDYNKEINFLEQEIEKEKDIIELVKGFKNQTNYENSSVMSDIVSTKTETINAFNSKIAENNRLINEAKPYQIPEEEMFAVDIFGNSDETFEHFKELQDRLDNTINSAKDAVKKLSEEMKKVQNSGKQLSQEQVANNQKEIKGLERVIKLNENRLTSLKNVRDAIQKGQNITYDEAVDIVDILQDENLALEELKGKAQDLVTFIKNNFKPIDFQPENIDQTIQKIEEYSNKLKNSYNNTIEARDKLLNNNIWEGELSNLIRGFSVLSSSVTSLIGIFSTWNNQNLSILQKFSSTLSVVTAQGVNLITHWDNVISSFDTVNNKILPKLVVQLKLMSAAEVTAGASATSMWTALLGPAALVVAAIAAVSIGIYALVKAENAEQDSINNLQTAAQKLGEQAKETKQAFTDLQSSFNEYQDLLKGLRACEEGTRAWADACLAVNEAIVEILDKYPELAKINGIVQRDKTTGALTLNSNLYNNYIKDLQTRYLIQTTGAQSGKAISNEKQLDLDIKKWQGSIDKTGIITQEDYQSLLELSTVPEEYNKKINDIIQNLKDKGTVHKYTDTTELEELINKKRTQAESLLRRKQTIEQEIENTSASIANLISGGDASKTENRLFATVYKDQIKHQYESLTNQFNKKIAVNTQKNSDEYQWIIDELNEALGNYGTYTQAKKENNVIKGFDAEKGITLYNTVTGEDEVITKEQWLETVGNYKALEYTRNEDIKGTSDKLINSIVDAAENKISKDTADLIISQDFNDINELTEEEVEIIKSHAEEIKQAFGEYGFESAEEYNKNFDSIFNQQWDAEAHAKKIQEAIKIALEAGAAKAESLFGLNKEDFEDYGKYLTDIADTAKDMGDKIADSMSQDGEAASIVTQSILRMNDGIDKLADGWKDWSDVLKKSRKDSEEYWKALRETQNALGDLLDVEKDVEKYFSDDWIEQHSKDIAEAAKGDANAIDRLRDAAADEIILRLSLENHLDNTTIKTLSEDINNLQQEIPNIKVGYTIQPDDKSYQSFLDTCQNIINTAGLTKDQANAMFDMMGFQATYETDEQPTKYTVPIYTTYTRKIGETEYNGNKYDTVETWTEQTGEKELEGKYSTFGMAVTPEGEATQSPKITGLTKKATGSFNNYSAQNKGGGSPGKNGGGGSDSKPDKMDPLDEEADRYHEVNTQITKVDNALKKLQSQQDKFVGKNLLDNLISQWEDLNTQIENYNEKLRIAEDEQDELRGKLKGTGVKYNADGTIANYVQAFEAQEAHVNSIIDKYNAMSKDQQETYKDTVEQAKKDFEEFKTNIDRYDELVSDFIPGLEQSIQDAIDKQIEIQIQKFNYEITIRLDLAEAERDWNQFRKKVIDEIKDSDILGNAKARLQDFFSYYNEGGNGSIQAQTRHGQDLLAEAAKMNAGLDNVYGDNEAKLLEDLKEYYDQLATSLEEVVDLQNEVHEAYGQMMDEVQEKFDDQIKSFDLVTSILEHDLKITQMVLGEESYSEMAKFYQMQEDNYNKQIDFQRQQTEFWREQMSVLEKDSEEWKKAKENWQSSLEAWQSSVETALENIREKFENEINIIFEKLDDKLTSGAGLDYVSDEWELIAKNSEVYLDNLNAAFGIQQLQKKYTDAINSTDNISNQQKLNALMEQEVAALEAKDKLTQYDLDRAEKRYNLAIAQMALEEAQQNKSNMRLRRDSQGNYTYQYVADENAISSAEDQLAGAYNDLYNFDKERMIETQQSILDLYKEYKDKEAEIANDATMSKEEKEAELAMIRQQYEELYTFWVAENQYARENLLQSAIDDHIYLYNTDLEAFLNMTQEETDAFMDGLVPQWNSGVQEMIETIIGEGGFRETFLKTWEDLERATEDYEIDLHELEDVAGNTFDTIIRGEDEAIDYTEDLIDVNDDLISSMEDELEAIGAVVKEMDRLIASYKEAGQAAIDTANDMYKMWAASENKAADEAQRVSAESSSARSSSGSSSRGGNSDLGNGGSGGSQGDGVLNVGDVATYTGGTYYSSSYGDGPTGSRGPGKEVTITAIREGRDYPIHVVSSDSAYGWLKKSQLKGYDTGGYTGDWNTNNGRLALLHQKELVLNSKDTQNILDAVSIIRNITGSLNNSILSRLSSVVATGANGITTSGDILTQDVRIEANFPNVTSSREIEEAIMNLNNVASQRIHEK